MEHHPLLGDYTYAFLDAVAFAPLLHHYQPLVFGSTPMLHLDSVYNEQEREEVARLRESFRDIYRLRIGIFYRRDIFVGWHYGWHLHSDTFYMTNTGILPEHQGKGIYSHLLPVILSTVRAQGFQIVESRHHAANNHVLVPKLKAGFVISGFEISDIFGLLVHLRYYFHPARQKVMAYRTGAIAPDGEIQRALYPSQE